MAEYIEREAALRECQYDADGYVTQGIKAIPAADVKPVVRGYWKSSKYNAITVLCSNCCYRAGNFHNYCPNCGADMREADNVR